jgi:cation transport ATPase
MKQPKNTQSGMFAPMLASSSRRTLYVLTALLVVTGATWLAAHFGRSDDALPSPVEPWSMKLHGAAAMIAIFMAGTIVHRHVLPGWRMRRNRAAGIAMCIALGSLAATGYGLYYFDGEMLRWIAERLHWAAGFLLPAVFACHVGVARMSRRGKRRSPHRSSA